MQANVLLRVGLALVFLYAAVASFIEPNSWIGYFPPLLRNLLPDKVILNLFSVYEIVLALWLVVGWRQFFSGLICALTLLGIIIFNLTQLDIIFRDVGLIFMALALMADSRPTKI